MSKQRGTINQGAKYKIIARDLGTCQSCGDVVTGPDNRAEVHHRDGDIHNNAPSNLETLCDDCHDRVHAAGIPGIIARIKRDLSG